jgi:FKBP-type peptidyl-prolyl cis-trans isomerase
MPGKYKLPFYVVIVAISMLSCECSSRNGQQPYPDQNSVESNRIEARRDFLKKERESIEAYQKDNNLSLQRTGTGLYYTITNDAPGTDSIVSNDVVEYAYNISSLDGELLYSSEASGTATLKIDKQEAEIGLHEALKLLGLGDEGLFILPSHLAFGVAGNQDKVPPMTPLRYELKVINIQKSKS